VVPVLDQVRELTASTIARLRGTDESREGIAASLGKRLAKWIPQ
jgi:methylglutaconyl-CoA hydratase